MIVKDYFSANENSGKSMSKTCNKPILTTQDLKKTCMKQKYLFLRIKPFQPIPPVRFPQSSNQVMHTSIANQIKPIFTFLTTKLKTKIKYEK